MNELNNLQLKAVKRAVNILSQRNVYIGTHSLIIKRLNEILDTCRNPVEKGESVNE